MESEAYARANIVVQVTCCVGIFCNLVVILVFALTKKLRVKYYIFVVNLVLADISMASALAFWLQWPSERVLMSLVRTAMLASEFSMLAVAINRLLTLTRSPSSYEATVTRNRMLAVCLAIWAVSAVICFPMNRFHTGSQFWYLIRPTFVLGIMVATGILYLLVFRKIAMFTEPLPSSPGINEMDEQTGTRVRKTRHLMVSFTIILVSTFICWFPFCVLNYIVYATGRSPLSPQNAELLVYFRYSSLGVMLSTIINPFVYWWRMEDDFRKGLNCWLCLGHQQNEDADVDVGMHTVNTEAP